MKKPEYFASIDLGSNAVRCLIAKKNPKGIVALKTYRQQLDLGEDVFYHQKILLQKKKNTLLTFKALKKVLDEHQVTELKAVATAAMRGANNAKVIIAEIKKHTQISLDVITGRDEALYVQKAVESHLRLKKSTTLLMDLGGGSIEFTLIKNKKIIFLKSFPIGTINLHKASEKEREDLLKPIREELIKLNDQFEFKNFIGTGGNLRRICKIAKAHQLRSKIFLSHSELKNYRRLYKNKSTLQIADRLKMTPKKAQTLLPSLMLIDTLMADLKLKRICLPQEGLKEGVMLDLTKRSKIKMKGMKKIELNLIPN